MTGPLLGSCVRYGVGHIEEVSFTGARRRPPFPWRALSGPTGEGSTTGPGRFGVPRTVRGEVSVVGPEGPG